MLPIAIKAPTPAIVPMTKPAMAKLQSINSKVPDGITAKKNADNRGDNADDSAGRSGLRNDSVGLRGKDFTYLNGPSDVLPP